MRLVGSLLASGLLIVALSLTGCSGNGMGILTGSNPTPEKAAQAGVRPERGCEGLRGPWSADILSALSYKPCVSKSGQDGLHP